MYPDHLIKKRQFTHGLFRQKAILLLLFCFAFWGRTVAQLFPGLEGEALADAIRAAYTPATLLNDTQAKDTLYARVFRLQDSVQCIYTGLARHLPEGVDPSQWLFGSGLEVNSLNLEHSWPQAKGAGEGTPGNTDMHHLYPSRTEVNSVRANHPFAEINDQLTVSWYYRDKQMSSIPVQNIDAYSEFQPMRFEPRESVKGDIARAMFYFWTIYREDALAADPFFFGIQKDVFCAWDAQDPADQAETDRTWRIAPYQDGKANPFVLDCSLARRAYCPEQPDCLVEVDEPERMKTAFQFDPQQRQFRVVSEENGEWSVQIFDSLGKRQATHLVNSNEWVDLTDLPPAVYFLTASGAIGQISAPVMIGN